MKDNCRVLIAKARYLKLELEECSAQNEIYKFDFLIEVDKHRNKSLSVSSAAKILDGTFFDNNFSDVAPKKKIDSDTKAIYKKIMSIVHPDKVSLLDDDLTKDRYSVMCSRANDAISKSDIYTIIDIADTLGIEINDEAGVLSAELKAACKRYEDEISGVRNTYPWIWATSDDDIKKAIILNYIDNKL